MTNGVRWKQRFENFERAYGVLFRLLEQYQKNKTDETVQMALVQAFEFTYELSWNTMRNYLETEGFQDIKTPRQTIRTAFQAGLIQEAQAWLNVIEKINLASHTYNQAVLEETVFYITTEFFPLAEKLYLHLKKLI